MQPSSRPALFLAAVLLLVVLILAAGYWRRRSRTPVRRPFLPTVPTSHALSGIAMRGAIATAALGAAGAAAGESDAETAGEAAESDEVGPSLPFMDTMPFQHHFPGDLSA